MVVWEARKFLLLIHVLGSRQSSSSGFGVGSKQKLCKMNSKHNYVFHGFIYTCRWNGMISTAYLNCDVWVEERRRVPKLRTMYKQAPMSDVTIAYSFVDSNVWAE